MDDHRFFECWVGAVWAEVMVLDKGELSTLIPVDQPKWRRVINTEELNRKLSSGEELQYHELGS